MNFKVPLLIFLMLISALINGQLINKQNFNTSTIGHSKKGEQDISLSYAKNILPSFVSIYGWDNNRIINKEIGCQYKNIESFVNPYQQFKYGVKLTQHFNYPIMHTSPVASISIHEHNIYLGPELNILLTKPKVDTSENWKPNHMGVNLGYRYIINSERKRTNLFLQMNFSFYQVKYTEYKSGSFNTTEHQKMIIENTGSMGINYRLTKKLEIYGGLGFGSTCGFFLLFKRFIPHSFLGVGYIIN